MERKTRRDRRVSFELEPLEGRKLMSVGSGPGNQLVQLGSRLPHATAEQPVEIRSIPMAVQRVGHHPHHAPKPAITAAVTASPDANGSVIIAGRAFPKAKVSLFANGTTVQTVRANAKGQYQFSFAVGYGSTPLRVSATAPGHKAASTTLTVSRTPKPLPGTLPLGAFQFVHSELRGGLVTSQIRVDFYADGTGEIQYELQATDTGTRDHWVWLGRWQAQGSKLEFVGRGTRTRTSKDIPSWNMQYSFNDDLTFPFFQLVEGGRTLNLTLADEFHNIVGPNGLTQNLALLKIGQH
jgi:hypothetical protein